MSGEVLRLLQEAGCFAEAPSGKGRPKLEALPAAFIFRRGQRSVMIALQVHVRAIELGDRRGHFMRAVREIAHKLRIDPDITKRYATRHASLVRGYAKNLHDLDVLLARISKALNALPRESRDNLPDNITTRQLLAMAARQRGAFSVPK